MKNIFHFFSEVYYASKYLGLPLAIKYKLGIAIEGKDFV